MRAHVEVDADEVMRVLETMPALACEAAVVVPSSAEVSEQTAKSMLASKCEAAVVVPSSAEASEQRVERVGRGDRRHAGPCCSEAQRTLSPVLPCVAASASASALASASRSAELAEVEMNQAVPPCQAAAIAPQSASQRELAPEPSSERLHSVRSIEPVHDSQSSSYDRLERRNHSSRRSAELEPVQDSQRSSCDGQERRNHSSRRSAELDEEHHHSQDDSYSGLFLRSTYLQHMPRRTAPTAPAAAVAATSLEVAAPRHGDQVLPVDAAPHATARRELDFDIDARRSLSSIIADGRSQLSQEQPRHSGPESLAPRERLSGGREVRTRRARGRPGGRNARSPSGRRRIASEVVHRPRSRRANTGLDAQDRHQGALSSGSDSHGLRAYLAAVLQAVEDAPLAEGAADGSADVALESLWGHLETSEAQEDLSNACAICLDDMVQGECVTTLPCQHSFHTHCICSWLPASMTCPLCKRPLATCM